MRRRDEIRRPTGAAGKARRSGGPGGRDRSSSRLATLGIVAMGVTALFAGGAAADAAGPDPAPAAGQLAQSGAMKAFDIPSQPLGQALIEFGQQAGLQVTFDPSLADGLRSSAVSGRHTVEEALGLLLVGLPITHTFTGATTVALERRADPAESSGSILLPDIRVGGAAQTATGPIDGYVATRSASATKTDTPIVETPRSISVVTADAISDRKAQNVEDALRYTPGVQVNAFGNDPRFDQIAVRGFDVTTDADFRDGLRQPNTGWLSYFRTEPYGLERIDVVKGPNSVLFGQISPGGMINRITKRPTPTPAHEVEVQLGTDEHYQGQFDLRGPVTEDATLQYRVVGLARSSETDLEGVIDDSLYIGPAFTWQPNEKLELTFLGHAQSYETSGSSRPFQWPSGELSHFWAGDEDFDGLKQTQYVGGYEAEYRFNEIFSFRQNLRYGYVNTENQYLASSLNSDGHTLSRTAYGVYETMRNLSVDSAVEARFNTGTVGHTVIAGADYAYINADVKYMYGSAPSIDMRDPDYHQPIAKPSTLLTDQDVDAHQLGLYLNDQVSWRNWRLSLGLRHDRAHQEKTNVATAVTTEQTDTAITGSAGLLYLFDSGFAPYVSYATSFIPQFGVSIDGDSYEPTEGEQVEIGLKYQPPGSLSLFTVSAYNLVEKNVLTADPANIANQIQTGEQRSRGIELEAAMNLTDGLDLVASYTWLDAEITESNDGDEGNRPVGVPAHMASVWGDYRISSGTFSGLDIGLGVRWVGASYADSANTTKNDPSLMVDARLGYSLDAILPGASVSVNATNLGDEEHVMCHNGYCYRGRGRTVIGSLSYSW